MKRYYLAPVVGTGTMSDPYRAKLPVGTNCTVVIPTGADGKPLFKWALVLAAASDHATIQADAALTALPDLSLDATLSTLKTAVRTALLTKLTELGVSTTGLTTQSTFRDVLRRVGQHLNASFNENNFDVAE